MVDDGTSGGPMFSATHFARFTVAAVGLAVQVRAAQVIFGPD